MHLDSFSESVLAGVVANGLTSLIAAFSRLSEPQQPVHVQARQLVAEDQGLSQILQRTITQFARSVTRDDATLTARLRAFITSAEVAEIVRNLSLASLGDEAQAVPILRETFGRYYTDCVGGPGNAPSVEALFSGFSDACKRAVAIAIDRGILAAHEANSVRRHAAVFAELQHIKRTLDILVASGTVDAFNKFEAQYREQAAHRHGLLALHHIDSQRRIPLDSVYVPPPFRPEGRSGTAPSLLELADVMSGIHRTVILGNPGAGKSTLSAKLCFEAAKNYESAPVGGRRLTPVLVVLRNYGTWRQQSGSNSLIRFIEKICLLQVPVVPKAVDYLLSSGRLLIVFDGLDELIDTSLRRDIRDDVESFASLYPSVPIVVTSREVGYELSPLDPQVFDRIRVSDFRDTEIATYVKKWFALDETLDDRQREEFVAGFVRDSAIVADLRGNPLMLALMCNIYRGEKYIPRNRPDVYEKCATLLFEKWDQSRGIRVQIPFEAHVGPAIRHIAFWIYCTPALQEGVTEAALIKIASDYLLARQFEEANEADNAARTFVEYCRGRAWVFTDTGLSANGEHLYQFTHRTFLEYFAASYLVRTNPTPDKLLTVLLPRIVKREWDVVAQVAFQLQSKNVDGAADGLLDGIVGSLGAKCRGREDAYALSFAARSLQFLVPTPKLVRDITGRVVDHMTACPRDCASCVGATLGDRTKAEDAGEPADMLIGLADPAPDNQKVVVKTLLESLLARILGEDVPTANRALELALHLYVVRAPSVQANTVSAEVRSAMIGSEDVIARRKELARGNRRTALDCYDDGLLEIDDVLALHGAVAIFSLRPLRMVTEMLFAPIALRWVFGFAEDIPPWRADKDRSVEGLARAGSFLAKTPTPWLARSDFFAGAFPRWAGLDSEAALEGDAGLGLLLVMLVMLEAGAGAGGPAPSDGSAVAGSPKSVAEIAARLADARRSRASEAVPGILDECTRVFSLDLVAGSSLERWVRGEADFLASPAGTDSAETTSESATDKR